VLSDEFGGTRLQTEVFLNNGDGTFLRTPVVKGGAGFSTPISYATADLNGDGSLDLVSTSPATGDVVVLLGRGDGTFADPVLYPVGESLSQIDSGQTLSSVAIADLNGDGRPDLIALVQNLGVMVFLGRGDGTFIAPQLYAIAGASMTVLDDKGDGKPDLVVAGDGIFLLPNRGDGTFGAPVSLPSGSLFVDGLAAADLNGDGKADLIANVSDGINNELLVLLSRGDGTFAAPITTPLPNLANAPPLVTDFNGDGHMDVAIPDEFAGGIVMLLGRGDGTFSAPQVTGSSVQLFPFGGTVQVGDVNGDGIPDLIGLTTANSPTGAWTANVSVWMGRGDGTLLLAVTFPIPQPQDTTGLVGGDFNGAGRTDLILQGAARDYSSIQGVALRTLSVLLNVDGTQFVPAGSISAPPQANPLLADLNGDGTADSIVVDTQGEILWRRGRSDVPGTFDPPVVVNPATPARAIAIVATAAGPVIAAADLKDDDVSIYAWQGGAFQKLASFASGGTLPTHLAAGDLNGDGVEDLVVYDAGSGRSASSRATARAASSSRRRWRSAKGSPTWRSATSAAWGALTSCSPTRSPVRCSCSATWVADHSVLFNPTGPGRPPPTRSSTPPPVTRRSSRWSRPAVWRSSGEPLRASW
jgi:hypothetical protein